MSRPSRIAEETLATAISPHLLRARAELANIDGDPIAEFSRAGFQFHVHLSGQSLWILIHWPNGGVAAARPVYSPGFDCRLIEVANDGDSVRISTESAIGVYHTLIDFPGKKNSPLLHWRTSLASAEDLLITDWPADFFPLGDNADPLASAGTIHATQKGPTGPILYASLIRPWSGSFLYVQNLTALNSYMEKTHSDPKDRTSSRWPELGFLLPTSTEHALPSGEDTVIGDAYILLSEESPSDKLEAARLFLDMYADVYLALPKPEATFRDWGRRVNMTVRDLMHSRACSREFDGHKYLLAYVGADDRPPESMVQLAVLLPMIEYAQWSGENIPLAAALRDSLPTFYRNDIKTIVRWLPSRDHLTNGEEHMNAETMDSWYLYHTLMNLSRLALAGDKAARELFLDSIDYTERVGRHFDYQWPVFYNVFNLDTIKAQTKPGAGGEHDVGAQYVHLMMQAFDLTGEQRFIDEAERAAMALEGLGFEMGYQLNNTSCGAGGLLRLWKETGKEIHRELSYVCIANVVQNFWLWDCKFGHAKNYQTFLGVVPLRDAVYIALYEELEILASFHEYLAICGDEVPSSIRLLMCEYCKYVIDRAWYHYPGTLPKDVVAEKPRSGHINPALAIPLEDIYDGWAKAGQVGQQVYGSAAPFVFATRHCRRIDGVDFRIHCDYPIHEFSVRRTSRSKTNGSGTAKFQVVGDRRCRCHVRIVPHDFAPLPSVTIKTRRGKKLVEVEGRTLEEGYIEYELPGDAAVTVSWRPSTRAPSANSNGKASSLSELRKLSHRSVEAHIGD